MWSFFPKQIDTTYILCILRWYFVWIKMGEVVKLPPIPEISFTVSILKFPLIRFFCKYGFCRTISSFYINFYDKHCATVCKVKYNFVHVNISLYFVLLYVVYRCDFWLSLNFAKWIMLCYVTFSFRCTQDWIRRMIWLWYSFQNAWTLYHFRVVRDFGPLLCF